MNPCFGPKKFEKKSWNHRALLEVELWLRLAKYHFWFLFHPYWCVSCNNHVAILFRLNLRKHSSAFNDIFQKVLNSVCYQTFMKIGISLIKTIGYDFYVLVETLISLKLIKFQILWTIQTASFSKDDIKIWIGQFLFNFFWFV